MNKTEKALESFKNDYTGLLEYLKARYPLFHRSNFFLRRSEEHTSELQSH